MLVYFAIIFVALIGFCGLAVDVGRLELRSLQLQATADAGALSGATEWGRGATAATWKAAALSDAQANQALNNYPTTGTTITSQLTASSGPYATDYAAVQTTVTQAVPTIFAGIVPGGATSVTVTKKAVADAPPCMYFLGYLTDGVSSTGLSSASINLKCPMYDRGVPVIDGFSHVNNHQIKSSAALSGAAPGGGSSTYVPFWNYPVLADPLAYVTAPTYTGCDNTLQVKIITPGQTLQPGRYCGLLGLPGITVLGVPVTMAPGLYVVTGGVTFSGTTVTGTGVTIYMTKGGAAGYGVFSAVNSTINLTAPTDAGGGGLTGITLFTDRGWVGGNQDVSLQSVTWYGDGIFYSKATGIYEYNSNISAPNYMNMVTANEYSFFGTITSSANYATVSGGSPLHNAVSLVQ